VSDVCTNCGAGLSGAYCAACGQKRFVETDRRFAHLVRQFVAAATDLDGRFWGSVRAFLREPGRLSRDYIEGRRARWMSPIALFLLINVAYFFFAQKSDFAAPFEWEVPGRIQVLAREPGKIDAADIERLHADPGPVYGRLTAVLVDRRVQARDRAERAASNGQRGYSHRDYRRDYDAKVLQVTKAITIVHVPLLALALMLLFWRARRYYAEHFVVALHLLAFTLALVLMVTLGWDLLHVFVPPTDWHFSIGNWFIRGAVTIYCLVALRRVYLVAWGWSAIATLGLFTAYVLVNVYLYRPVLFLTVFALT
jgi:hypothetical protein